MLNYLWALMILIGIMYGVFTGNVSAITEAAIDSSGEAVSLCITMAGIMAFWMGLMEIATQSGIVEKLTGAMGPVLGFLFPELPLDSYPNKASRLFHHPCSSPRFSSLSPIYTTF